MREPGNIRAVEALGIDMMGFIFWPPSVRYVASKPAYLPEHTRRVGVFVDADIEDVLSRTADFGLDIVQLHGSETPAYVRCLRERLAAQDVSPSAQSPSEGVGSGSKMLRIIKALPVATASDLAAAQAYDTLVDAFLFDTRTPLPGGSGCQFDWDVLADYDLQLPFLLSGGIGPDDADRLRRFSHPRCIGFDINSRFESAPAVKDINALDIFLRHIRQQ